MAYGHANIRRIATRQGFTIVELLIVVVIIAILAAITIVAYNGIQNRAKQSAAQSAAQQASKKILTFAIDNAESYPAASGADGIANLESLGVVNSSSTTYQYSSNNTSTPRTFCITATTNKVSYYVSQSTTKPTVGACPGHGVNGIAAITNLSVNPALNSNTNTYGSAGATGAARVAISDLPNFSWAWQANSSAVSDRVFSSSSSGLTAGVVYTASVWAKYSVGSNMTLQASDSAGSTTYQNATCGSQTNVWQRCSVTFTATGTSWRISLRQTVAGTGTIALTGVMITEGSSTPNFADGNSANWVWNGTADNSTSTGPPL